MFMNPSMNHCPEFLRLLTHATFFEAAIAQWMSLRWPWVSFGDLQYFLMISKVWLHSSWSPGISTLLQVTLVTVWQCNLNGDKLDFRVVNLVVSGDFIVSILDSGTWQHGQLKKQQQQHRVQHIMLKIILFTRTMCFSWWKYSFFNAFYYIRSFKRIYDQQRRHRMLCFDKHEYWLQLMFVVYYIYGFEIEATQEVPL